MRKLSYFIIFFISLFMVLNVHAVDPVGFALLSGQSTTTPGDPTDLNQAPAPIKWSASDFDSTYFSHSTTTLSHELKIKTFGNYKLSLNIPLTLQDTSSQRRQVIADVYVNGVPVSYGRASSSYIRQTSGHNESSLNLVILLESLQVNDAVTVYVGQGAVAGRVTTSGAQLFLEFIDPAREIFAATATQAATTNVNPAPASESGLRWNHSIQDAPFTHNNSSNTQNVTIGSAGNYWAYVNMPMTLVANCDQTVSGVTSNRVSVQLSVKVNGAVVNGGVASQGYIRCYDGHNSSSVHWFGLIEGLSSSDVLTFEVKGETNQTTTTNITSGKEASLFLEKADTASDFISLTGTQVMSGNNWNPDTQSETRWSSQGVIDSSIFSHSTSTNNHLITILSDGDYSLVYSDFMSSSSSRPNNAVRVKVNGSIVEGGECKTHYIRNGDSHTQSSCSLSFYLQRLSNGDQVSIEHIREANSGTVNDSGAARLVLQRVGAASGEETCENIIDCTENRILHYDGQQLSSVLDDQNRVASDSSFDGTSALWKDISGSDNIHNSTQATASNEPTFNSTTMGLTFDGTNDHFDIANHSEINTGTLKEKSIVIVFRTGADVTTPQVIYEEGGGVRGMNVYIRAGQLYIAFWNLANDGDGAQPFTFASTSVAADSFYYASLVIDYSNYTGPTGPDGQLRGHINGVAFATLGTTTSLLYPHGGRIGLGGMQNDTYFDTGAQSGTNGHFFGGEIYEFILYNHAITNSEAVDFYNFLSNKWPDPQPVTNLALDSSYTSDSTASPNVSWTASVSSDVVRYETAVGETPGGTEEQGWTSQGLSTSLSVSSLSLDQCRDYYISVKAVDGGGDESTVETSEFFRFDGVDPSLPSGINVSGVSSTTVSKEFSWTSSTDDCSLEGYEVSLGTTAGDDNVVTWESIDSTVTHTFRNISPILALGQDYFFNIRAKDEAGNLSAVVSSAAWQVDTCVSTDVTPPTAPGAVSVQGDASSTSTPVHGWTASTDACGFSHYEMAVGTSVGGQQIQTYADIDDVTSHKFFGLANPMSANVSYYTSIRAVDLAGNYSSVVTSAAWQLPSPGGVSSGLALWLDADDATTLFTDSGCSTGATNDSDAIGCWMDKSPNGNNSTASGAARPLLRLNQFNGKQIIRFDGSNDALDFSNINDLRTVFIVNKSSSSSYQQILGHTTSRHFYTNNATLLDSTISSADLRSGTWRVDQADVAGPSTFTQTSLYSMISVVSNGNVEANHLASDRKTGGRFFSGDIVEVILYDRVLNTSEITSVESYLYNKWFTVIPAPVSQLSFSSNYSVTASETPTFTWTHSPSPDVDHYQVALGTSPGSNNISGWTAIGLKQDHKFIGLNLTECTPFYAAVRTIDTDGYTSEFVSTQIGQYDQTAPPVPTSLVLSGTSSVTDSPTLTWSPSNDGCSDSVTYEVALGTSPGDNGTEDWVEISETQHEFESISPDLLEGEDYYFSVRAKDEAGNLSNVVSSSAWQVDSCISGDVTPPTNPTSLNLSGNATVIKSPQLSWGASSDACSFDRYEVSIGTTAGATNVESWVDVGQVTNYQFVPLSSNLSYSQNYFLNVRAVDSAGNSSSTVSSLAWQVESPGGVSPTGLTMWLDANDSHTLFQNSDCSTSPVTLNNQSVRCLRDKSGTDNHATNAGVGEPQYKTTLFNSKPSLYFNGSSDEFLGFSSSLSNIRTVFWVLKEDSSNPGNTAFLLGNSAGATYDFHRDSTSGPIFSSANASASVTGGTLQQNGAVIDGTVTSMPTSEAILSLVTTGNVSADSLSRDRTSCCGNRTWGGFFSEIIIFNRALSGAEVANVENYLMLKWGISSTATQWLGSADTNWFNPTNWSNNVPDSTKTCIIPNQANNPIINGTAVCQDVEITTGHVTFQNSTSSKLSVYGNFSNSGNVTYNDGQLEMRDDGVSSSTQTVSSVTGIGNLTFNKTSGGEVIFNTSSLTVSALTIPLGSFFNMRVPNGVTLNLTTGMTQQGGTVTVEGGGTLNVSNSQMISVTGGTFRVAGTNDAYPQTLSNKGTITSAGRWGFEATSGQVSLTGFLLNRLDVNGLRISGSANLTALDGGQFTELLNDFSTPVRAVQLNTSQSLTESLASNVGFSWSSANATYSGIATPASSYYLVYAPNCNNSVLVFDQWFGDFWGTTPEPVTEDKIHDTDDGATCQITMDIAASPVHLIAYSAVPYDQEVSVEWETGSELNHLGFNIYRSETRYGNYQQVNSQMIQNFVNTTTFKGSYRYVDSGLTNGKLYYYMIEDVALNGAKELHGPVVAQPQAAFGAAPADSVEDNTIADGNDDGSENHVVSDDLEVVTENINGMRLVINPSTATVSLSNWDTQFAKVSIPGYGHTRTVGAPELLTRRFLIEVDHPYSNMTSEVKSLSYTDISSDLSGKKIHPAPEWVLNNQNQTLEPQYALDSNVYALNDWTENVSYSVNPETIELSGKFYVQVELSPLRYNPVGNLLEKIETLVLDISLDEEVWSEPNLAEVAEVEPEAVANNLKIFFDKSGLYEVAFDDLVSQHIEGPFVDQAISDLRLYHGGVEIPLEIESADSQFNAGDVLRFFVEFHETLDSDKDLVVLSTVDLRKEADKDPDFTEPLRMTSVENGYSNQPQAGPGYYLKEAVLGENLYPVFDVPMGSFVDHIFWKRVFTEGGSAPTSNSHHDFSLDLTDIETQTDQEVVVEVSLRGRGVYSLNPDHHLQLIVNGTVRGDVRFSGHELQTVTFSLPSQLLNVGNNNFRLTTLASYMNSGDYDIIDINEVHIKYPARFIALNDQILLKKRVPNEQIIVEGFSAQNIKIYDVSHRYSSMIYQTFAVDDYNSAYLLQFDSFEGGYGEGGQKFFITLDGNYSTPTGYELTYGSKSLIKGGSESLAVQYLLVAPRRSLSDLKELVTYRESQGLLVKAIAIEQVYDEFSSGRKDFKAVKKLVDYVREHSQVTLKYLFLVGDATYDSKGDLNAYGKESMPVPLIKGSQMDFASDTYFVTDEASIPQVSVGRLPTQESEKIKSYIDKLKKYESGLSAPVNSRNNVFISGLPTRNENYEGQVVQLESTLTAQNLKLTTERVVLSSFGSTPEKKSAVESAFDQSSLFLTYMGHGAEDVWGGTGVFANADVSALDNEQLPIVVSLNCLNSHFYDIDSSAVAIGESFIFNPSGGAIAFWGSTSQTAPVGQLNLAKSLFNTFAQKANVPQTEVRLGDILLEAQQIQSLGQHDREATESWVLFGDPALKLPASTFPEVPQENPTVNVQQPGNSGGSGGGCSLFAASDSGPLSQKFFFLEFFFFLLPLILLFSFRRRSF